jgi:hypothetical protein
MKWNFCHTQIHCISHSELQNEASLCEICCGSIIIIIIIIYYHYQ